MVLNIINSTAERYRNNVSIVKSEEAAAAGNNFEGRNEDLVQLLLELRGKEDNASSISMTQFKSLLVECLRN